MIDRWPRRQPDAAKAVSESLWENDGRVSPTDRRLISSPEATRRYCKLSASLLYHVRSDPFWTGLRSIAVSGSGSFFAVKEPTPA
jgi:hypothetical protein